MKDIEDLEKRVIKIEEKQEDFSKDYKELFVLMKTLSTCIEQDTKMMKSLNILALIVIPVLLIIYLK